MIVVLLSIEVILAVGGSLQGRAVSGLSLYDLRDIYPVVCSVCDISVIFCDLAKKGVYTAQSCIMTSSILTPGQGASSDVPDSKAPFCGMYVVRQTVADR